MYSIITDAREPHPSMHATAAEEKSSTELHLSSHSMAEVVPITVTGGVGAVYLPTSMYKVSFTLAQKPMRYWRATHVHPNVYGRHNDTDGTSVPYRRRQRWFL